jgi:hypothetical protein
VSETQGRFIVQFELADRSRTHVRTFADLGDALTLIEAVFHEGFLVIRHSDTNYEYIPVARIIGCSTHAITPKDAPTHD